MIQFGCDEKKDSSSSEPSQTIDDGFEDKEKASVDESEVTDESNTTGAGTLAISTCPNPNDLCISGTISIDLEDNGEEIAIEGVVVEVEDDPSVTATTTPTGAFVLAIPAPTETTLSLFVDEEIRKKYEKYKSKNFNVIGRYEKNGKRYAKRIPNLTFLGGNILDLGALKLEETGAIQGTVSLADGANPLGIDVYIPGTSFTAKASDTGSFFILYVPAGKYDLIYEKDGYYYEAIDGVLVRSKLVRNVSEVILQPIVVDTEPPMVPTPSPIAGELTNDPSPTLSWSESSEDTAYYELQVDVLSSFNSTNLRSFTDVKLLEQEVVPQLHDGLWYYRVRAIDYSNNTSEWSIALTVNIDTQPAGVPVTNLFPSPTNDATPTFTWKEVTGASGYRIQIAEDDQFVDVVVDDNSLTSVNYTPSEEVDERLYFWRLASLDSAGNQSDYSLPKQFEVDTSLPDPPQLDPISTPTNNNTLTLTWTPVTGANRYRIQIDDSPLFTSPQVDESNTSGTSFTTPLLPDGKWYLRVAALDLASNQSGFSLISEVVVDTTAPSSPTLTNVAPDPNNDKTPLLRWHEGIGGFASFEIEIDTEASFTTPIVSDVVTNKYLQVSNVLPEGAIHWRVRQIDHAGNPSTWSSSGYTLQSSAIKIYKIDETLVTFYCNSFAHNGATLRCLYSPRSAGNKPAIYKWHNGIWSTDYYPNKYGIWQYSLDGEVAALAENYAEPRFYFFKNNQWNTHTPTTNPAASAQSSLTRGEDGIVHYFYYSYGGDLIYQKFDPANEISETSTVYGLGSGGGYPNATINGSNYPEVLYWDFNFNKISLAEYDGANWNTSDTGLPNYTSHYWFSENIRYSLVGSNIYKESAPGTWNQYSSFYSVVDDVRALGQETDGDLIGHTSGLKTMISGEIFGLSLWALGGGTFQGSGFTEYGHPMASISHSYLEGLKKYIISSYPITMIDSSSNQLGMHTSLSQDQSIKLISYTDETNQKLKAAYYNGETWNSEDVDLGILTGQYSSSAINAISNYLGVSYYDANLGNLKYAFNNNNAGWILEVVDSDTNVGQYTSLQINSSDHPRIAYYDVENGDLKYAAFDGASWALETIDSTGDVGQHTDLELTTGSQNAAIAYYNVINGDLKFAAWNGTSWDIETVDSTGDVGKYAALELRSDNDPVILYYDATNKKLKLAEKDSGSWTIQTINYVPKSPSPATSDYGQYCDLVIESDDDLHISFYDTTNTNLIYGYSDNTQWGFKIADGANVEDGNVVGESVYDFTGDVGKWSSIDLRQENGAPGISYFDETEGILKYLEGVVLY